MQALQEAGGPFQVSVSGPFTVVCGVVISAGLPTLLSSESEAKPSSPGRDVIAEGNAIKVLLLFLRRPSFPPSLHRLQVPGLTLTAELFLCQLQKTSEFLM